MVVSGEERTRIPFLRGILIRSLQDSGLPFEEAYRLATEVRDELAAGAEIEAAELKRVVGERLARLSGAFAERYRNPKALGPTVLVALEGGQTVPFSRGRHRTEFESCGLDSEQSAALAKRLHDELLIRAEGPVPLKELRHMIHDRMRSLHGEETAHRYVAWVEFQKSDRPLLVLLGGTAGTGKSSISAQLAHRLEIVRTQSTDMLREVMRMMMPERLLPVLHSSSFTAWQRLPGASVEAKDLDAELASGYLTQTELLAVAVDAVLQRALRERVSLILEGVHVHPLLLARIPQNSDVIVVPVLLAVLDRKTLRDRIKGRAHQVPARRSKRYLEHFEEIWRLQSFLLSEADRAGISIIANDDRERTSGRVMATIMSKLASVFEGTADQVF
jgi:2-phosphoglycerate kinase